MRKQEEAAAFGVQGAWGEVAGDEIGQVGSILALAAQLEFRSWLRIREVRFRHQHFLKTTQATLM